MHMLQHIKKWSLALETVDSRTLAPTHHVSNTHENNFSVLDIQSEKIDP